MSRDYKVYLDDILESISRIRQYTSELRSADTFVKDQKTFDAVIRNLEIIGEAVRNIPEDVRAKYPSVEWRKMMGLRNILAHQYFGVSPEIVWDIIVNKITVFEIHVREIIKQS